MNKTELIEKMRKDGYLTKFRETADIKLYEYDIQPLNDGLYNAIYHYPGGTCCHALKEIETHFEIIEQ